MGENTPEPDVDHNPPPAFVTVPEIGAPAVSAQTTRSIPASASGASLIVIIKVSLSGKQTELTVLWRMIVTFPAAVSAASGKYEALRSFAFGLNDPPPSVVQVPVVVNTETEPLSAATALFLQMI